MTLGRPWLRRSPLLAVAALALHELRYLAEYGTRAPQELNQQGHSYLPFVEAIVLVSVVVALAGVLRIAWRARHGHVPLAAPPTLPRAWLFSATTLLAVYTVQEGLEGSFAPGHPAGIAGIYGHGGWTAILFAAALGLLVAVALRGAHVALHAIARRACGTRRPRAKTASPRPRPIALPRPAALAGNAAGRAPPLTA